MESTIIKFEEKECRFIKRELEVYDFWSGKYLSPKQSAALRERIMKAIS